MEEGNETVKEKKETVELQVDKLFNLLNSKDPEGEIIELISKTNNAQRQEIKKQFITQYGQDLTESLEKKLSGNFKDLVIALFDSPIEYDAKQINKAVKGAGTDDDSLIELIGSKPNCRLEEIKAKYEEIFNKSLIKDVEDDTSGTYKHLFSALLQGGRSENPYPNEAQCVKIAEELYESGEKIRGTDDDIFVKHFAMRSPAELAMIGYFYEQKNEYSLLKAIDKEFSGDMKTLLTTIYYSLINPAEYFATRVNKAIKGLGTNNNLLIRVMVSRSEIDMPKIKAYYQRLFKKDMIQDIKDDTSGDYQSLLIHLAGQ